MRISDWSSDVCSSDLPQLEHRLDIRDVGGVHRCLADECRNLRVQLAGEVGEQHEEDRKSVVSGQSVSVRVDLGGRRIIKKKNKNITHTTSIQHKSSYIAIHLVTIISIRIYTNE